MPGERLGESCDGIWLLVEEKKILRQKDRQHEMHLSSIWDAGRKVARGASIVSSFSKTDRQTNRQTDRKTESRKCTWVRVGMPGGRVQERLR